MKMKLYVLLAQTVAAYNNCLKRGNAEWKIKHQEITEELVREHMPSGSGIDKGTQIDWTQSNGEKLVFQTSFHHMNEHGVYDGWTDHTITVVPSLSFGITVRVGGLNRRDIKDYLHDVFSTALNTEIESQTGVPISPYLVIGDVEQDFDRLIDEVSSQHQYASRSIHE